MSVSQVIIYSDNGFSPVRCKIIIWTNVVLFLDGPLETQLISEILIWMHQFYSRNRIWKCRLSGKWWLFCVCLNVLTMCCMQHSNDNSETCIVLKLQKTYLAHGRTLKGTNGNVDSVVTRLCVYRTLYKLKYDVLTVMPPSHCRECCLRTNTNWHSLRIAQHRIDSNYFVLVRCHFRISSQANTNVLKCSKHSY